MKKRLMGLLLMALFSFYAGCASAREVVKAVDLAQYEKMEKDTDMGYLRTGSFVLYSDQSIELEVTVNFFPLPEWLDMANHESEVIPEGHDVSQDWQIRIPHDRCGVYRYSGQLPPYSDQLFFTFTFDDYTGLIWNMDFLKYEGIPLLDFKGDRFVCELDLLP